MRGLEEQGFTGKPELVSSKELDAAIRGGDLEMYRGVGSNDPELAKKYLTDFQSGDLHPGTGMWGSGTYAAVPVADANAQGPAFGKISPKKFTRADGEEIETPFGEARAYATAGHEHGWVFRMALRKDARIGKYDDLVKEQERFIARLERQGASEDKIAWHRGFGRWATAAGYDGFFINATNSQSGYFVLLNRTAVRVQRKAIKP